MKRHVTRCSFFITTNSFTLVELLVVIGILAILTAAVVIILNPAELLRQSRDATRMADLTALDTALSLLTTEYPSLSLGTVSTVYVSLADSSSTCGNLSLPTLPSGYSYHCVATSTLRNIDGTGWIPVSFASSSIGSFSALPIDPINIGSLGNYYTYSMGGSWEVTTLFESTKYRPTYLTDGGDNVSQYEKGTSLTLHPYTDAGLIGYWTFDEGSGTVAKDMSGQGNDGTLMNFGFNESSNWKTSSECKVGGCLRFDGSNDYVNVGMPGVLEITGPITLTAWAKVVQSSSDYQAIISRGRWSNGGYLLTWHTGSGTPYIFLRRTDNTNYIYASAVVSPLNSWYFFAGTYDGSTIRMYANGVGGQTSTGIGIYDNNLSIVIGRETVSGLYLNGYIDDVRIYNRALSAGEIKALYNAAK